ncbi:MAG: VaFE repeat-containing surface-anchored protein, partial [Firmicutes bacterium]|nr:VaFE repeat-containing surface-anchored protein [Bacillota bacterium]
MSLCHPSPEDISTAKCAAQPDTDINDEEQTVRIPKIRTVAKDGKDGDKNIAATK